MPESVSECESTRSADTADRLRITRRTVLTAVFATSGAVVLGNSAHASAGQPRYLDVSRPEVHVRRNLLRLAADRTGRGEAVPLELGTSQDGTLSLTVASASGLTTVGAAPNGAGQGRSVTVRASKGQQAVVWVTPRKVGSPLVPADRLTVTTPHGKLEVEAWIEPVGGDWRPAGKDGAKLDLGIVAMHSALMRMGDQSEIVMWSIARKRNDDGSFMADPKRPGAWLWKFWEMDDVESRALNVDTLAVRDRRMDADGHSRMTNVFCGGNAHLPDGRLLVVGGHVMPGDATNSARMFIYDSMRKAGWAELPLELDPNRWYPTVTALPDGRMLITSGSREVLTRTDADDAPTGYWNTINNDYQIFDPSTGTMADTGPVELVDADRLRVDGQRLATYPGVFVLPGTGRGGTVVALVETNRAWLYTYDPARRAPLSRAGTLYPMHSPGSRSYPTYGAMVLLPLKPGERRMRILALGGQGGPNPDYRSDSPDQPATATAEILDVDTSKALTGQAGWREADPMRHARILCDATLLADGTVLVSGGAKSGWGDWNRGPVLDAELFDPDTETFSDAAPAATERRYHSTALLQPDGTVLKAGSSGGFGDIRDADGYVWMRPRFDAERYFPPYLWRGPRPSITGIAGAGDADGGPVLHYGTAVTITASGDGLDAGTRVGLVRLGATTHGSDMDQRYVWLQAKGTATAAGWRLTATPPANPAAAPPGDYLLFVVDGAGVPSEGAFVRVAAAGS